MRSVEVTAKSREEAIDQALGQLGVGRDEIDVEILQEGSGGLFGFGARQWKLRVGTEAEEPAGKAKSGGGRRRGGRGRGKTDGGEPRGDAKPRSDAKPRQPRKEGKPQSNREDKPKQGRGRREGSGRGDRERNRPERSAPRPPRAQETPGEADVAAAVPNGPRQSTEASDTEAAALLQQMIELMGIEATVTHVEDEDKNLRLTVSSEDSALLIGRKGRGLAALQYVINRVAREIEGRVETERIIVDVEGYLDRRKQSLEDMALRMADRVKETNRRFRMRPMNPQERRVVHVALQEDEEIRTFSVGDSAIRSVVIAPKDEEREERPRRRGGRGRGPRREERAMQDESFQDEAIQDEPLQDAPLNDAPMNDAPMNDAPMNDAPMNDAPMNDAPMNDAPMNDEPMNDDEFVDAQEADDSYEDSAESAAVTEPAEPKNDNGNGESTDESAAPKRRRRTSTYRRTRR